MGMMEHQPFNDGFTKFHGFWVRGGNDHAVLGRDHTAHLDALYRSVHKFYGTNPARSHRTQGWMITEPGDHDAQLRCGLNHHGFRRNFYFSVIDNKFGHFAGYWQLFTGIWLLATGYRFPTARDKRPETSHTLFKRALLLVNMFLYLILKVLEQTFHRCDSPGGKGAVSIPK